MVIHAVLIPSLNTPFSVLGYWQCFMWCLFPFDKSLFSLGLLTVLHVVLVPSLPSPCSALGCYSASCGACSLFDQCLFSLGLLAVFHMVLVLSVTSPFQPWVDSHAPSGLVKFDVNKKLSANTV
jgi:hypothetical protein